MKYWMLAAFCSGLCAATTVTAGQNDAADVVADQVFRAGLEYCNQASKVSRTDASAAREHFAQYLSHLERAKTIAAQVVQDNSYIQREARRCSLVEDNIARLEAMTLAQASLDRCGEVRMALDQGALTQAQTKFNEYETMSQQALAVTPTVLRVGSLGVQFRRCDQLVEKISLAKVKRSRVALETERTLAGFKRVMDSCSVAEKLLQSPMEDSGKLQATKRVLEQVSEQLQLADRQAAELVRSAVASGVAYEQQVTDAQYNASACRQNLLSQVSAIRHQVQQAGLQQHVATVEQPEPVAASAAVLVQEEVSPYAAKPKNPEEVSVIGGVVQLGTPEF
ncbi:hypothetical protein FT643_00710 [Ketobacter sp. MCCC 1A13808]|uniref:hypothetical protein n=1 Tax=Ketobacter sp. MCCC 1A13808 TaxID=2602738 RepID=UPI0012EB0BF8|nr:hypothetical protein [Ketobacter sp. MCCC 1A13808]MVF10650.1 hypothetical protein [Ketobacter sp. MCCC 1A13808]